ncbi:argininosuccinate lyase [bacterium F11]|nr:argininosuccinate lyase [bacterium F11]
MKSSLTDSFVSSFSFDLRLAPYDIEGSLAHVTMLGRKGILPEEAVKKILQGLKSILGDVKKGKGIPPAEDIHFAIEKELIRRVGSAGKMMHTARSRNDQVITDLCLYLRDHINQISTDIKQVQRSLILVAEANRSVVMPGFTHLQHAQPILFSHHLLAYAWMLERDKERLKDTLKRLEIMPLGSAALAGTSFPIDRLMTAKLLKFKGISENSIDATSSRDGVIEFVSTVAIVMTHLSRLAEDLIIWSSSEFSFVQLGVVYTTGSSIMPQKKNPDMAELVRGKTGRVVGNLMALLTLVKGTPLAYNRDLQEDKPPLFDAVDTVRDCLGIMAGMIKSMKINKATMKLWCQTGFLEATEVADYLAKRGVPFRSAHGTVQKLVTYCESKGKRLEQLTLQQFKKYHSRFDKDVFSILKPERAVEAKTSYGGTSPQSLRTQLGKLRRLTK